MDENNSSNIAYFLLGAALGATVALLLAPQSGRETRGLIRSKVNEGGDYVRRRGSELRDSAGDYIDKGKSALLRQKEQMAAAVEAGRKAYRETVAPGAQSDMEELGI